MHLVFLPGAGGAAEFWHPLGALLPPAWRKTYVSWPGLGDQKPDPSVHGFDDLVTLAEKYIDGPTVVIAQSMGGIVAIRLALKRAREVTHLVLVVTSGGVPQVHAEDWRPAYRARFPHAADWITTERSDHSADFPRLRCRTLVICGDADPICPLTLGQQLVALIPNSDLRVIRGGTHDLGNERASDVAPLLIEHLA